MSKKNEDHFLLTTISETFGILTESVSNIQLTQYHFSLDNGPQELLDKLNSQWLTVMNSEQFSNSKIYNKRFWLIVDIGSYGEIYQQIILPLFVQNSSEDNEVVQIIASRNLGMVPPICNYIKISEDHNLEFESNSFIQLLSNFIKEIDNFTKSSSKLIGHHEIPVAFDNHEFIFEINFVEYKKGINETALTIIKNIRF